MAAIAEILDPPVSMADSGVAKRELPGGVLVEPAGQSRLLQQMNLLSQNHARLLRSFTPAALKPRMPSRAAPGAGMAS